MRVPERVRRKKVETSPLLRGMRKERENGGKELPIYIFLSVSFFGERMLT